MRTVDALFRITPRKADIIVANTYPFDTDMRYMLRGFWPLSAGTPQTIKVGANILRKIVQRKNLEYLIFSPMIRNKDLAKSLPNSMCFEKWEAILAEIKRRTSKKDLTVAIYPYAPLQFPYSTRMRMI